MTQHELMIGDWVLDGNNVAQITSITCDGIIETTFNEISNIEVIHPIPLTPEILKKNGFKYRHSLAEWVHYNPFPLIDFTLLTDEEGFHLDLPNAKIKYVHELQHALRLCNIDKEIVL